MIDTRSLLVREGKLNIPCNNCGSWNLEITYRSDLQLYYVLCCDCWRLGKPATDTVQASYEWDRRDELNNVEIGYD